MKIVAKRVEADVEKVAPLYVRACVAHIEGTEFDDTALRTPPFKAQTSGSNTVYGGKWSGQNGFEANRRFLALTEDGCDFNILTTSGQRANGGAFQKPAPLFEQEMRKAEYQLTNFKPASAGGTFASAGLGALVPGPTQRVNEGSGRARKGDIDVLIRVVSIKRKSDLLTLGHLLRVVK